MILTPEQLQDLGMAVFRGAGVPEESSASVVEALVRAELDGLPSHGFSRIPFYVDQALSGKVKARAIPLVRQPAFLPCWWMRETVRFSGHSGGAGKGHTSGARQRGVRIGSHPVAPLRRGWTVCGTDRGSGAHIIDFFQHAGGDGSVERIKGVLWDESASLWLSEGGEASAGDRYVPEQSGAGQDHGRETAW